MPQPQDNAQGRSYQERWRDIRKPRGFTTPFGEDEFGLNMFERMIPGKTVSKVLELEEAAEAHGKGEASREQVLALQRFNDQRLRRGGQEADIGGIVAGSLEIIPGFLTGSVLVKGGTAVGKKVLVKRLGAEMTESIAKKFGSAGFASLVGETVAKGTGNVIAQDVLGGLLSDGGPTLAAAHKARIAESLSVSMERNEMVAKILEDAPSVESFLPKAFVQNVIQTSGEYGGGAFAKLTKSGQERALSTYMMNKVAKKKGDRFAAKMLETMGVHGIVEELGEEVYSAALNDLTAALTKGKFADQGQLRELAELENATNMVIGIGLSMGAMNLAVKGTGKALSAGVDALPGSKAEDGAGADTEAPRTVDGDGAPSLAVGEGGVPRPIADSIKSDPQPDAPLDVAPEEEYSARVFEKEEMVDPTGELEDIGGGQLGNLGQGNVEGKLVRKRNVVEAAERVLHAMGRLIETRYGRAAGKALGSFRPKEGDLRVMANGDIRTATHEIGHAIELLATGKRVDWRSKDGNVPETVHDQIFQIGYAQAERQGLLDSEQDWGQEGFAEFISRWLMEDPRLAGASVIDESKRDDASTQAIEDWVFNTLLKDHPDAVKQLHEARKVWKAYRVDQGPVERGIAATSEPGVVERIKDQVDTKAKRNNILQRWITNWIEEYNPVRRLVNDAKKVLAATGKTLHAANDSYKLAKSLRGAASDELGNYMQYGVHIGGEQVSKSLYSIMEPVREQMSGNMEALNAYLTFRHVQTINSPEVIERKGFRETAVSIQDANAGVKLLEDEHGPMLRQVAEELYVWRAAVMQKIGEKDALYAEHVKELEDAGYHTYIPMKKDTSEWFGQVSSAVSAAHRGELTKALTGSMRDITPPLETLMGDLVSMISRGNDRAIFNSILELAATTGDLGGWIVDVPVDKALAANPSIRDAFAQVLRAAGASGSVENVETLAEQVALASEGGVTGLQKQNSGDVTEISADILELLERRIPFFAEVQQPKPGQDYVMPYMTTGGLRYYSMNKELFESINGAPGWQPGDLNGLAGAAWAFAAGSKRVMTMGTTGANAEFAFITNTARDVVTLPFNITTSPNPVKLLSRWFSITATMAVDSIKSVKGVPMEDLSPITKAFNEARLNNSTFFSAELRRNRGELREVVGNRRIIHDGLLKGLLDKGKSLGGKYLELLSITERSTRAVAMVLKAEELGVDINKPETWSETDRMLLNLEGRAASTDFRAGGIESNKWNMITIFHKAAIQGPRITLARTFEKDAQGNYLYLKRNAMWAGFGLMAPTLVYWLMFKDDDWYKALSAEEKAANWYFPVGESSLMKIPKPFELAAIAATPVEFIASAAYEEDPQTTTELVGALLAGMGQSTKNLGGALIPPMPISIEGGAISSDIVPVRAIIEQRANKNLHWGTPIVSRANLGKREWDQYTENTSGAAIWIAEKLKWAPDWASSVKSPQRLDHLVRTFTGSASRPIMTGMGAFGTGTRDIDMETDHSEIPLVGRLFVRGGRLAHSKNVRDVYDAFNELKIGYASKEFGKDSKENQAKLLLGDAQRAISMLGSARRMTESKSDRYKVSKYMNELALKALADAKAMVGPGPMQESLRAKYRNVKKQAKALEEQANQRIDNR